VIFYSFVVNRGTNFPGREERCFAWAGKSRWWGCLRALTPVDSFPIEDNKG
jgi:hypothetical protein